MECVPNFLTNYQFCNFFDQMAVYGDRLIRIIQTFLGSGRVVYPFLLAMQQFRFLKKIYWEVYLEERNDMERYIKR